LWNEGCIRRRGIGTRFYIRTLATLKFVEITQGRSDYFGFVLLCVHFLNSFVNVRSSSSNSKNCFFHTVGKIPGFVQTFGERKRTHQTVLQGSLITLLLHACSYCYLSVRVLIIFHFQFDLIPYEVSKRCPY
jgi:hypothetical protein